MTEKKKHKSAGGKKMQTLSNRVAPLAPGAALASVDMQQYMRGNGQVQAPATLGEVPSLSKNPGSSAELGAGKGIIEIPPTTELKVLDPKISKYNPGYYEIEKRPIIDPGCDIGGKVKLYGESVTVPAVSQEEVVKPLGVPETAVSEVEVSSTLKAATKLLKPRIKF